MKQGLLGIILFFITINLSAQITITDADYPSLNDSIIFGVDTNASISVSGKGLQTWDFSMLDNEAIDTLVFVDPATTTFATSFINADLATEVNGQTNYYSKTTGLYANDGFAGDPLGVGAELALPFDNLQALMVFPATYTSLMSDTSDAEIKINAKPFTSNLVDSARIKHTVYSNSEIDGYGSLTLPNGQTYNTLKQSSIGISIDSVWIYVTNAFAAGGLGVPVNQWVFSPAIPNVIADNPILDTLYTHNWIAEGKKYPLVETTVDTLEGTPLVTQFRIGGVVGATLTPTNISCNGMSDGAIEVTPSVGFSPYTYEWSNGETSAVISGLASGTYIVTVTDMFSDTVSTAIELIEPAEVSANLSITDVTCFGESNGSIEILNVAGNTPYSFLWSNGVTTEILSGLAGQTLGLTITANGCEGSLNSEVVGEPSAMDFYGYVITSPIQSQSLCDSVSFAISVTGGNIPYEYLWETGNTTDTVYYVNHNYYNVTVSDSKGCNVVRVVGGSCVGINELAEKIQIYPNPTTGNLKVDLSENVQIVDVTIFDALGKEVLTKSIKNRSQLDLSNYNKGLYYIRISTEEGTLTRKITLTK